MALELINTADANASYPGQPKQPRGTQNPRQPIPGLTGVGDDDVVPGLTGDTSGQSDLTGSTSKSRFGDTGGGFEDDTDKAGDYYRGILTGEDESLQSMMARQSKERAAAEKAKAGQARQTAAIQGTSAELAELQQQSAARDAEAEQAAAQAEMANDLMDRRADAAGNLAGIDDRKIARARDSYDELIKNGDLTDPNVIAELTRLGKDAGYGDMSYDQLVADAWTKGWGNTSADMMSWWAVSYGGFYGTTEDGKPDFANGLDRNKVKTDPQFQEMVSQLYRQEVRGTKDWDELSEEEQNAFMDKQIDKLEWDENDDLVSEYMDYVEQYKRDHPEVVGQKWFDDYVQDQIDELKYGHVMTPCIGDSGLGMCKKSGGMWVDGEFAGQIIGQECRDDGDGNCVPINGGNGGDSDSGSGSGSGGSDNSGHDNGVDDQGANTSGDRTSWVDKDGNNNVYNRGQRDEFGNYSTTVTTRDEDGKTTSVTYNYDNESGEWSKDVLTELPDFGFDEGLVDALGALKEGADYVVNNEDGTKDTYTRINDTDYEVTTDGGMLGESTKTIRVDNQGNWYDVGTEGVSGDSDELKYVSRHDDGWLNAPDRERIEFQKRLDDFDDNAKDLDWSDSRAVDEFMEGIDINQLTDSNFKSMKYGMENYTSDQYRNFTDSMIDNSADSAEAAMNLNKNGILDEKNSSVSRNDTTYGFDGISTSDVGSWVSVPGIDSGIKITSYKEGRNRSNGDVLEFETYDSEGNLQSVRMELEKGSKNKNEIIVSVASKFGRGPRKVGRDTNLDWGEFVPFDMYKGSVAA